VSRKSETFESIFSFTIAETYGSEEHSILQTALLWKANVSAYIGPQETWFDCSIS
jgi:hypothetical protein